MVNPPNMMPWGPHSDRFSQLDFIITVSCREFTPALGFFRGGYIIKNRAEDEVFCCVQTNVYSE